MAIEGNWNISISTPMGEKAGILVLALDGTTLTGSMTNEFGEMPLQDGTADGNELFWRVNATLPMPMVLEFTIDVDGDNLIGTVKFGPLGDAPVKGSRV